VKPCGSGDHSNGVISYDDGADYFCLRFSEGYDYTYTWESCSRVHVQNMKALANQGKRFMAYLNWHASEQFASKLPSPDPAAVMVLNEAIFDRFPYPLSAQIRHDTEVILSREADLEIDVGVPPPNLLTTATANEICRYCERYGTSIRADEAPHNDWLTEDDSMGWPDGVTCVNRELGFVDLLNRSSGIAGSAVTPKQVIAFVLFSELSEGGDAGEFDQSFGALKSQLIFAFAAQLAQDVD
tara:strand:+ start:3221 stop:3943 length:723 start_codon:yes stop_codon:yes gene_type:complete